MTTVVQPIILSGGSGTRLWPLSREALPKQFLTFDGPRTLLQATWLRIAQLAGDDLVIRSPIVVCSDEHRFVVADQLEAIGVSNATILTEPVGRNTAPALTLAALWALRSAGLPPDGAAAADPIMVVLPADHHVRSQAELGASLHAAISLAASEHVVTLGVPPRHPETGFGYLRVDAPLPSGGGHVLGRYVEKPDLATARELLASGAYWWNSGIFVMRAQRWLEHVARYAPDIERVCSVALAAQRAKGWRARSSILRVALEDFEACPSNSIDYAVMEALVEDPANRAAVVPLDAGWSDLGTWSAMSELGDADARGNVGVGDVLSIDTDDSILWAGNRLLATLGVRGLVVVDTDDATLVASRERAQDVKAIVDVLRAKGRSELRDHSIVDRPWGQFQVLARGPAYQVKRITLRPGAMISMQLHRHRTEHWVILRGQAEVTHGEEVTRLGPQQSTMIHVGVKHRLANPGPELLELLEVQWGSYLGEDDIVRFDDVYDR
ncbi:MAG: mannose-1-phosphate guanylyltransferase/mannose-6-phosphate isomerase [Kofleriaceae bacterium]